MKIVYLDTETTSTIPGQICELSMITEVDFNFVSAKNYFFAVSEMSEGAQGVHGMSLEDTVRLSNGKVFADYKDEILSELEGATLLAHNEPFDERFISSELWRCGISFKPFDRFDTMDYFRNIIKLPARSRRYGPYKNPKLSEVLDYLNINTDKISSYTGQLFGENKTTFHDSRYDTACLYVMTNVYREKSKNLKGQWQEVFCN